MRKKLGVFLILIFLPVCESFGALGQAQGFLLGADNGVLLNGGLVGSAQNTNLAVVGQSQKTTDLYNFTTALQFEGGVLIQGASAIGMDGVFGVGQNASTLGGQLQTATNGVGIQNQSLDADFVQAVAKNGGIGAALGIQGFVGLQLQVVASPKGANTNVQYLGLGQVDKVGGGP